MSLTFADATLVANHVIAAADAHNAGISVAVCDVAGDLVVLLRSDGAPGFSADFAAGKAYTSARFKNSTAALEEAWAERPVFAQSLLAQGKWFVGRGGEPLRRNGEVIGGVGVSGNTADLEAELAVEAADLLDTDGSREATSDRG